MLRTAASRTARSASSLASTRLPHTAVATSSRVAATLSRRTGAVGMAAFHSASARASSSKQQALFRLDPPTAEEEQADFQAQVDSVTKWFASPRFAKTKRPYSAELVATKRGTQPVSELHPANISAKKLWAQLERAAKQEKPLHTMGAIDPVQMTQQAPYLDVLYVSGWASSSVLTTGFNEVGPDLADYPYTTVPNQVQRLRKAQELHDRKMWDERRCGKQGSQPWIDYLRPIIADGDTGCVFFASSEICRIASLLTDREHTRCTATAVSLPS